MPQTPRNILITGAGAGIGRATARLFIARGWRVALLGRNDAALVETAESDEAMILPADVGDPAAVEAAFAKVEDRWGRLDVLFNNAGTGLVTQTPDEVDPDEFRRVIEVNVTGVFICARAAFRVMRAQHPQGGRIINNGSVSAHAPRPGSIAYTTSKHAVTGITRSISLDGRPFNIACGQIDIGNALTDMAQAMTKGVPQADGSIRVEAVMDAQVVADTVLHMASLPEGANVQFVTVMATNMPFIGRG